jgi:hypothetical protein
MAIEQKYYFIHYQYVFSDSMDNVKITPYFDVIKEHPLMWAFSCQIGEICLINWQEITVEEYNIKRFVWLSRKSDKTDAELTELASIKIP